MLGRWRRRRSGKSEESGELGEGDAQERSPSGAPVYRHEPVERDWQPPALADTAVQEAIEAHLEVHLGECRSVWHEIISDMVHLDVYMWTPTDDRPMHTFVTVGMSTLPMTVPQDAVDSGVADRVELVVCLPPDWPVPDGNEDGVAWDDDSYYPISWLKQLARLPHEYETWLGFGHTVPNGDPAEPLAATTQLSGWMLAPPVTLPPTFHRLHFRGGRPLDFYGIVALHPDELDYKLAHGADALLDIFDREGVTELLDPQRPSTLT